MIATVERCAYESEHVYAGVRVLVCMCQKQKGIEQETKMRISFREGVCGCPCVFAYVSVRDLYKHVQMNNIMSLCLHVHETEMHTARHVHKSSCVCVCP